MGKISYLLALLVVQILADDKCRALILGGGGPRGAYEAGAIQALSDYLPPEEIKYDIISGISIGAMNACFCVGYEQGQERAMAENLVRIWKTVKKSSDLYSKRLRFFSQGGLFNTEKLYKFIVENTGEEIKRNIAAAATDYNNGGYVDFNTSYSIEILQKACYASGAYPPFFPPVNVLDSWYGDGAMVANANPFEAVEDCRNKGFNDSDIIIDVIYCVPISSLEIVKVNKTRDTYYRIDDVSQYFSDNWYLETAKKLYKNTDLRYFIVPKVDFGVLNVNPDKISLMINTGYNDTLEVLQMTTAQRKGLIKEYLNFSYKK